MVMMYEFWPLAHLVEMDPSFKVDTNQPHTSSFYERIAVVPSSQLLSGTLDQSLLQVLLEQQSTSSCPTGTGLMKRPLLLRS